jgi:voltage-gated potassium channel
MSDTRAAPSHLSLLVAAFVRRAGRATALFAVVYVIVSLTVWRIESPLVESTIKTLGDAFWYSLATLSTVGYGDVSPKSVAGRAVGAAFIVYTLATVGYLLSQLNESVLEVRRMEDEGLIGTRFSDHVIVVGFGAVASAAIIELIAAGRRVALLCERNDELEFARRLGDGKTLFISSGEPTQKNLAERMNVASAQTAVVASNDDATNIVAALNLRALNKDLRIVVAVKNEALRQTLITSGVTYVASPYEFSGRLVASAAFEPEVAHFIEDLSSGAAGADMQQVAAGAFATKNVGQARAELEAIDGPMLVALARCRDDGFELIANPGRTVEIRTSDQIIVLGSREQLARMARKLGVRHGL